MGHSESDYYADIDYVLQSETPLDTSEHNAIIEGAVARMKQAAKEYDVNLGSVCNYEISSRGGSLSRKLMRVHLEDQNKLVDASISSQGTNIQFMMKAKPNLKEGLYTTLEKIMYESSQVRYQ